MVEQATENRRVPSSNLGPGTFLKRNKITEWFRNGHHLELSCAKDLPKRSRAALGTQNSPTEHKKNGMVLAPPRYPLLVLSRFLQHPPLVDFVSVVYGIDTQGRQRHNFEKRFFRAQKTPWCHLSGATDALIMRSKGTNGTSFTLRCWCGS